MKSVLKKISIFLLLFLLTSSTIACDLFTKQETTTTTQLTSELTTAVTTISGTWWQAEVDISISGSYKTVYELGETLDTSLLVVESVNGLGFKTPLSADDYTISGFNSNTTGLKVVTVTYKTFTTDFVVYVKEASTISNLSLEVTPPSKTDYTVGEEFDSNGLEVRLVAEDESYIVLNNTQYTLSGFNSSSSGTKTITVSTLGLETTFTVTVTGSVTLSAYYQSVEGLSGQALEVGLRAIVSNYTYKSYDAARYILDETDRDPYNPNNLILVYLQTSVSSVWDSGVTWNREHVWPQSLLNYDSTMTSDLHNLKPADNRENSSRGNKYFDNSTTSSSYCPPNAVKGDIARILFYMVIRYEVLNLVDRTPGVYEMAMLSVLLTWHELDPVDDFERNRNEVIYSYQKNRNPFIDYPSFVDLIWES